MTVTTNDIRALIDFVVLRFRTELIQAMNATGNAVPASISGNELEDRLWDVFAKKGLNGLRIVLSRIAPDRSRITQEEAMAFRIKFEGLDPNAKFKDWFNNAWQSIGDFLGGSATTVVTPTTQQQTSTAALSPFVIGLTVVAGIVTIGIFRKFTAVVVGVIVIVLAVVLYGIFAKNVTLTSSGGGGTTQEHGGVGAAFLNWVTGIFK